MGYSSSEKKTVLLAAAFVIFSALDIITTYLVFQAGGIEINPPNPFNGSDNILGIALIKAVGVSVALLMFYVLSVELKKEKPFHVFDKAPPWLQKNPVPVALGVATVLFGIAPCINNTFVLMGVI